MDVVLIYRNVIIGYDAMFDFDNFSIGRNIFAVTIIRGSREEISLLLADDFVEFGVSRRTFDKLQVVEELPHSPAAPVIIEDFQVKVLAPDVVLATYRAVKTNESREEMRNSLRSSIWKFLDGRWQMVFHHDTRAQNNHNPHLCWPGCWLLKL